VIRSSRRLRFLDPEVSLAEVTLAHSRARLQAIDETRVISEDRLLSRVSPRFGRVARPFAIFLLEGRARVSTAGRHLWMSPGELVVVCAKGAAQVRTEGARTLSFEWDSDWLGDVDFDVHRFSAGELSAIFRGAFEGCDAAALFLATIAELRQAGLALRTPSDFAEDTPERMHALTRALDEVLSNLEEQPMLSDLEARFGLSTRQLHRTIAEYNERYGFDVMSWIDARNQQRLSVAVKLMTVPGASVERVSCAVGYRRPTAFARALASAGLPSPSRIAEEVRAIGESTGVHRAPDVLRATISEDGDWAVLSAR
jgi:methylphosphotriester-DNA--protein-cysteine methyltransferase